MGIYTRDNINYGGMLGNAMRERANYLQHKYDAVRQMGQNWGNAIQQGGKTVQDAIFKIAGNYYDQDKLAAQQQFQHDEALLRAQEAAKKQAEQNAWQAEQNAYNQAQALQRAREQQAWQAQQNQLQRESTEKIAELNRGQTNEEHKAQNIMNYQNALSTMQYAQQALDNARPGSTEYFQAQRDLAYAKSKAEYYQGLIPEQLWYKETTPVITGDAEAEAALKQFGTPEPLKKWQIEDLNNEWKALNERSGGKYDDATAARMNEIADLLNDESLRVKTASKGKTSNQINAETNAAIDSAITSGDSNKLPSGYIVRSFPDGRYVTRKDASGKWIKVKKWGN